MAINEQLGDRYKTASKTRRIPIKPITAQCYGKFSRKALCGSVCRFFYKPIVARCGHAANTTGQDLLRAMDALMDHAEAVEIELARQIRPLVNRDQAILFYDLTTVHSVHNPANNFASCIAGEGALPPLSRNSNQACGDDFVGRMGDRFQGVDRRSACLSVTPRAG